MTTRMDQQRLLLGAAAVFGLLLAVGLLAPASFRLESLALHASLEATAALAELMLAGAIVLLGGDDDRPTGYQVWIPLALAVGGTLDLLHAAVLPGAAFYWLRTVSTVAVGLLLALSEIPASARLQRRRLRTTLEAVALAALVGGAIVLRPERLPPPLAGRDLTGLVVALNLAGGLLAALVGLRFTVAAWRRGDRLLALLAAWCLYYGVAAALFAFAPAWGALWWLRHGVRVAAGVAVLACTLAWLREAHHRLGSQTQQLRAISQSHRRADTLLEGSEKRFGALFENAAIGLALVAPSGAWLRVNRTLSEIVGYSQDELLGLTFQDLTHPDDLDADLAHVRALLDGETDRYTLEERYLQKAGSVVWIELTVALVRQPTGEPDFFVVAVQDIAATKQGEAERAMLHDELDRRVEQRTRQLAEANGALQETTLFLDSILENIPDMIFLKDVADMRYVRFNRAGEDLLGLPREAMLGKTVHELFPPGQAATFAAQDDEVLARPDVVEVAEEDVQTPHRGVRVHHTRKLALRDRDGAPRYLLGIAQDVTESRRAREHIRELNSGLERRVAERTRELEESNRELEAFSYSVSHDLRAPLRAIHGYAGLLRKSVPGLEPTALRYLDAMARTAAEAGRQVDALLEFSRLGRAGLETVTVDSEAMVSAAIELVRRGDADREIAFDRAALPSVQGDPYLLRLLWINVISNAVKFTRGRTPAEVSIGSEPTAGGLIAFSVRDNGVGFDMQHAKNLFGVFQRLHAAEDYPGTGSGTGIGLAIARRVVERHGGMISAAAEPGGGATFRFTLPAAASP